MTDNRESHFCTYIDGAVRNTKEEDRDGQLNLRWASIIYFRGSGVILPKWIHELSGLSCQERWWLDRLGGSCLFCLASYYPSYPLKPACLSMVYKPKARQQASALPVWVYTIPSWWSCVFGKEKNRRDVISKSETYVLYSGVSMHYRDQWWQWVGMSYHHGYLELPVSGGGL